jgi:guanyl-specific ribonuclease Sa
VQQWHNVPHYAEAVAQYAANHQGQALPGYVGNRPYANDGRGATQVLPRTTTNGNSITYREYDVHPYTPGVNRGPERVVIGSDGSRWYTANHYSTFTQF